MTEFTTYDYAIASHERQKLDVFKPVVDDLRTAVLIFHGGAFLHGDRTTVHARCRSYAARGFTAIAIGYRLLDSAPWPAPLNDAQAALAWVVEHSDELGIDPQRIVLQGHSAGAQLAVIVAGKSAAGDGPAVSAVVSYYAPLAMAREPGPGMLPAQMLLGPEATAEAAEAASPIFYAGEKFPPAVLIHGAADRFIPAVASLKLFEALEAAGVVVELHVIAGQDHEFDMTPRYNEVATDAVVGFLRAQVLEPEMVKKEVQAANPFVSMPPPGAGEH